ncbi:MAG: flagellar M-ring protein FliF [Proteobacteria bacterium SG_bin7]|nr:MAG: flagellar M-ring protein FliF [Proteobacteria bacterium SG_bin7]
MNKFFTSLVAQFKEFYKSLTPVKRASLIGASVTVLVASFIIAGMISGNDFKPLFKNVSQEQLPMIVSSLQQKNVPFKLTDNGGTVAVPATLLHATQMALMAEMGSKNLGSIGLELFDKQDFGTTSYVQRINYQRALQGELVRAINTLTSVKKSKVILALPEKKTFLEEGGKASASVVVELYPGKVLTEDQVRGITNIVGSAVEGLSPDQVTVVDSFGKMLSRHKNDNSSVSTELIEAQQRVEQAVEAKVEEILGKVVGGGKVIARANVVLNPNKTNVVEETYDQDKSALRSVTTEEESLNGARTNPVGVPGARANLPGAQDTGQVGFNQNQNKEVKSQQFEVPKIIRQMAAGAGSVEKVSVAVLVDGMMEQEKGENGEVKEVWRPRAAEDIQKYEDLVKNAIGFSSARGDSVKVESFKFNREDFEEAERQLNSLERRKLLEFVLRWLMLGSIVLVLYYVLFRPFTRWITDSFQDSVEDILPKTIEELEELQTVDHTLPGMTAALPVLEESIDPDKAESELLREKIMGLVERDSEKSANAFGLWLSRRDS